MGYKKVCFHCKKAFSVFGKEPSQISLTCPECSNETTLLNHKFRPPKKIENNKWKVVEFLKNHGFVYQHIFMESEGGLKEVNYPVSLKDAQEFVNKYKSQAYTDNNVF